MYNDFVDYLVKLFLKQKKEKDLSELLKGLLTDHELKIIANRLEIVTLLKLGFSQRAIKRELDVGRDTIVRLTKNLELGRFNSVEIKPLTECT